MKQFQGLIEEITESYKYSITVEFDRDIATVSLYNNHINKIEYEVSTDEYDNLEKITEEVHKYYQTL
jgi:hypothetical protein